MSFDDFQFWLVNFVAVAAVFVLGWLVTAIYSLPSSKK